MKRRDFLKTTATGLTSGAMWLAGWRPARSQKPPAHVVEVFSESVQREHLLDGAALRAMLDEGIRAITGKRTAAVGWKMLVEPNDVVAIRISATVSTLSTHHALVDEVIRGLIFADVPPENILIWDRFSEHLARYAYAPKPVAERGFTEPVGTFVASEGVENGIVRLGYDETVVYESDEDRAERREASGTFSLYANLVTKRATRIVNLPVLKVHPITGLSGALSSLAFASVNNTRRFHPTSADGVPAVADIWTNKAIKDKHAITIVDALKGAFATGPGYDPSWQWESNRLYFSRDPVALDTALLNALNERRQVATEAKLRALSREAGYLSRAATLAVGSNDKEEIRHEKLTVA
jgi:uncharacterized protein (DUF362 family)